jgi:hypothetical protein
LGTLTGWAKLLDGCTVEHTYVSCNGYTWSCFGDTDNGREITRGNGSSAVAHCISLPSDTAGIIYGLSGVCQQAANRILWPARTLVTGANGYWVSALLFGTYGTSDLEWLARLAMCSDFSGESSKCGDAPAGNTPAAKKPDKAERAYHKLVRTLYMSAFSLHDLPGAIKRGSIDINLLARDRELLMDYRLGVDYRPGKRKSVLKRLRGVHRKKKQLDGDLYADKLSLSDYVNEVNTEVEYFLDFCSGLLGEEDYRKLMGIETGEAVSIINERIASELLTL